MSTDDSTLQQRKNQQLTGDVAAVFGSSGACGKHIVSTLLDSPEIGTVYSFRRSPSGIQNPKYKEVILTGDLEKDLKANFPANCDVVFSGLATTLKQAGSQEAMHAIDYGMNDIIFTYARSQEVPQAYLVSSTGADENSWFFYPRVKGQLESRLQNLNFGRSVVVQPGFLVGAERTGEKSRLGEGWIETFTGPLTTCLRWVLPSLMPIQVKDVGEMMTSDYIAHRSQNAQLKSSYSDEKAFKPIFQRVSGSLDMLTLLDKYRSQDTIPKSQTSTTSTI